jgi:hypothetical protein
MFDMLQLLSDTDVSEMAVSISTSQGEVEFIQNVDSAARLIVFKSGPSYGRLVISKPCKVVPEAHLAALQELAFELEAGGSI